MDSTRLVQVIYGEGAGKTTMALGKALRAYGNDLKVAVVQFMKPGVSWWDEEKQVIGEVHALRELGIQVHSYGREEFVRDPTPPDFALANEAWDRALSLLSEMDVVVLDEILNALAIGLLTEDQIVEIINDKTETELILTGRILPDNIKTSVDQVTRVESEKHPLELGIQARRGFEY